MWDRMTADKLVPHMHGRYDAREQSHREFLHCCAAATTRHAARYPKSSPSAISVLKHLRSPALSAFDPSAHTFYLYFLHPLSFLAI